MCDRMRTRRWTFWNGRSVIAFDVVSGIVNDIVSEIDSFSRGKGRIKLFSLPPFLWGHTLVPRDGACLRRILVIIARRAA